jgi:hypothetical protein
LENLGGLSGILLKKLENLGGLSGILLKKLASIQYPKRL